MSGRSRAGGELEDEPDQSLSTLRLSVRATNCLRAVGIQSIEQLVQLTDVELLRIPNLGRGTLANIQDALSKRALARSKRVDDHCSSTESSAKDRSLAAQDRKTTETTATVTVALAPELVARAYLRQFSDRKQAILQHRIFETTKTLEGLGKRFDVSRERIRQLQSGLTKDLRGYLRSVDAESVCRYAADLRTELGTAVPRGRLREDFRSRLSVNLPSADDRAFVAAFFLWTAGPYVRRSGWVVLKSHSSAETAAALRGGIDERGWVAPDLAREILGKVGIRVEYQSRWLLDHGFAAADEGWLPKLRSIPDCVEQILRYRRVPMTPEELVGLVKCDSDRSLRNRLLDDARFKKISRQGHFALREWPEYDEYTGIADEIAEEIERQGGSAVPNHLIDVISQRYGVKPGSVYQYLSAPMFIRNPDGRVRLRAQDESLRVQADPRMCPGLYLVDEQWRLRIEINSDTLRGSGRPLQTPVAVLVGCQPGERMVFKSPCDEIVISWPPGSASGPNLGSLRPDVESLGGQVGDFVFLTFGSAALDVHLLRARDLENEPPSNQLALLVGISEPTESDTDRWRAIASAIGVSGRRHGSMPEDIHAALMRRNEVNLARLVGEQTVGPSESIFDQLERKLGL